MEKNNFKIYSLASSNAPDEIRYIGYTGRHFSKRLKEHIKEFKFRNGINKKTHKDNWIQNCLQNNYEIILNIIEENISEDIIEQKEIFYIAHFKKLGYKLVNGTGGGDGQKYMSNETKEKIRQAHFGKSLSNEHIIKISKGNLNKKRTNEQKVAQSLREIKKPVLQYSKEGIFIKEYESLEKAATETGVSKKHISSCYSTKTTHKYKRKSAGGYMWVLKSTYKTIPPYINAIELKKFTRHVLQYDLNGVFIREYNSIKAASVENNIQIESIKRCCKNKQKQSNGYYWKYLSDRHLICQYTEKCKSNKKPIIQFSLNNEYLAEYESITFASNLLNINCRLITGVCNGKHKSTHGFIWKFKN
jgi:hypothetical protein